MDPPREGTLEDRRGDGLQPVRTLIVNLTRFTGHQGCRTNQSKVAGPPGLVCRTRVWSRHRPGAPEPRPIFSRTPTSRRAARGGQLSQSTRRWLGPQPNPPQPLGYQSRRSRSGGRELPRAAVRRDRGTHYRRIGERFLGVAPLGGTWSASGLEMATGALRVVRCEGVESVRTAMARAPSGAMKSGLALVQGAPHGHSGPQSGRGTAPPQHR